MPKLTLSDLASLSNPSSVIATINANNALIETAIENTLSRDGTSPNGMGADLDMDGNDLLNLPSLTTPTVEATTSLTVGDLVIDTPLVSTGVNTPSHYVVIEIDGTEYKLLLTVVS